jgi:secreted PhoX family phosphatase
VSPEYRWIAILPWGAPLFTGVPAFDAVDTSHNTWQAQERQVGIGHDGMWLFTDGRSNDRGVLCLNNEFGDNLTVLGRLVPESLDDVRKSQAAHGVTVVELARSGDAWAPVVPGARNRRIHANTPVAFSGPAAGSELLSTAGSAAAGTLNNWASATPRGAPT